jgi:hypothetical protein
MKWQTINSVMPPEPEQIIQDEIFEAEKFYVKAPDFAVFVKHLKDTKQHFSRNTSPKYCPVCKSGPIYTVQLKHLLAKQDKTLAAGDKLSDVQDQELEKMSNKVAKFDMHKAQLIHSRTEAYAIRDAMTPGQVFVTRDYVNHHDHAGEHVKCLILVLQWRASTNGPLLLLKIRNFCSDKATRSTDMFFTRDVMDFHLKKAGYFLSLSLSLSFSLSFSLSLFLSLPLSSSLSLSVSLSLWLA